MRSLEQRVQQRTEELANAHDQLLERSLGLEAANRALERQTSAMRAQQLAALNLAEDAQQAQQMAVRAERALAIQAEELRVARDTAQAATRTKSNFLATMSHEIRTPMNGIIGMTDLLLESPLTADQREQLVTVQRSGHALLAIINDILDFSKVEAGKLVIEWLPTELRPAIDDVLQLLRPRALEKGLELSVECAPGLPEAIETDPGRLRQVLTNLVGNAIKFTAAGRVRIHVEMEPAGTQASLSASPTPARAFPPRVRSTCFSRSASSMSRRRDVSAEPGSGWRSAGSSSICSAARSVSISPATGTCRRTVGPGSIFWFSLPATVSTGVARSAARHGERRPRSGRGARGRRSAGCWWPKTTP